MGFLGFLSPKKRIWGIVDAVIDRLRDKYDLAVHTNLWIQNGKIKIEINPELGDRRPEDKIEIDRGD